MCIQEFRFNESTGELYEIDDRLGHYVFAGKYSGMTEKEAIDSFLESQYFLDE